jgi:exodeoxyribonuclease VII large subunit
VTRLLEHHRHRLESAGGRLESYGKALFDTLRKGFAIVRDAAGMVVESALGIAAGDALSIQFHDGRIEVVADGAKRPAKPKKPAEPGQGSLL